MSQGTLVLKSNVSSTNPDLRPPVRDPLIRNDNDGVRFIADMAFGYSYPGGPLVGRPAPGAPLDGAVVYDVAERANADVEVRAGSTISYAGGGFDFTPVALPGSYLRIPAAVSADLWADQEYLICQYVKLPTLAEWSTIAARANFYSTYDAAPTTEANIVDICQFGLGTNSKGSIRAYRQTAINTDETLILNLGVDGYAGAVVQLAYWRSASEQGLRVKNATGTVLATSAAGAKNTANFSTKTGKAGITPTGWSAPSNVWNGSHATAHNWRLYRIFIENLARSERSPHAVLDADYDRVMARGAFS